jgi:4-amino-4-deoxy-L-arabinose transferase-like glycosyltransferase
VASVVVATRSRRSISVRPTAFVPALCALAVLGVVLRVLYAVVWEDGTSLVGDPSFFQQSAANLAHGSGYAMPFLGKGGPVPTALHPPVFPGVLAALDVLGLQSADAHRIALAFLSSGTVVLMGLLGRRLMSPGCGLVAAAIAAVSPLWVQWGGRLMSECLYLVVIPGLLLVALECVDRPNWWIFGLAGVAIGIATLTRSEAIAFLLVLGVPLVWMGSRSWAVRARFALALVAGLVVVVGPWLVRNEIELGGLSLSTDSGTTWVGSYSTATFSPSNPLYGSFDNVAQFGIAALLVETSPPDHAKAWTELTLSDALEHAGLAFARGHLGYLPGVVLAREGRLWGVYAIGTQLQYDSEEGGQVRGVSVAGQFVEWISIPLAIAGGIVLGKRSRRRLVVIVAPVVVAALSAALFYGSTRLRVVAEPSLYLLAAIALVTGFRRIRPAIPPSRVL